MANVPVDGRAIHERRWRALKVRMAAEGMDALVVSNVVNLRYLTGHAPPISVSPTRPWHVVLPRDGDPVAVVPTLGRHDFEVEGHAGAVLDFASPAFDVSGRVPEGVARLVEALGPLRPGARIGIEHGPETRVGATLSDLKALREAVPRASLVDAGALLHAERAVKDATELAAMRRAIAATGTAHDAWREWLEAGRSFTELELHRAVQVALLEAGADAVPYLVVASGRGGYDSLTRNPSDRPIDADVVVGVDVGATSDGYFADFNRNRILKHAPSDIHSADRMLREALDAGIDAVRPGVTASSVWHAMTTTLGGASSAIGRLGHGVGLDLTEPPSIHPHDHTVLREGMILSIEPSLTWHREGPRALAQEEMVRVTTDGAVMLTTDAGRK